MYYGILDARVGCGVHTHTCTMYTDIIGHTVEPLYKMRTLGTFSSPQEYITSEIKGPHYNFLLPHRFRGSTVDQSCFMCECCRGSVFVVKMQE